MRAATRERMSALNDGKNWGAGASGSPVVSGPYRFLSSKERS
jgi:hypothetical protein